MLTGEVPPHAVLLDAQSMAGRKMAFEHLAAPATIEADDIIAVNWSTDRHSREFALRVQRALLHHSPDQRNELLGVEGDEIFLSPHLADALFERGIEIEYRLEGNLNHMTVIQAVM
jgi:hypothetical protein